MQLGPRLARTNQSRREDHSMESDIVLAHELIQLDVVLVLPPLLPEVCVGRRDRNIADRSIEPDIEDLVGELVDGDFGAPLEIASDASAEQALLEHGSREADRVGGPLALDGGLCDPLLKLGLDLGQVDEDVLAGLDHRGSVTGGALGINQLHGIDKLTTAIALVTLGISVATALERAPTTDHSISQWRVASIAVLLL